MSFLDIISKLTEENGEIYLKCCPISDTVPADQPNLREVNKKYYSCKVILVRDNESYNITDWFSVPKSDLNLVLKSGRISGDAVILIDKITDDEKSKILENTCAVFTINNDMNKNILKWLDDK